MRSPYAAQHYNDAPPYHDSGAVGNAGDRWSLVQADEKSIYLVRLYSWKDCEEIKWLS